MFCVFLGAKCARITQNTSFGNVKLWQGACYRFNIWPLTRLLTEQNMRDMDAALDRALQSHLKDGSKGLGRFFSAQ
jgi:hypothetical protein